MNMSLFMFLVLRLLFRCLYFSFKQISNLDLPLSVTSFVLSPEEVLIGRRGYVPLRHLGDVPLRRCWVFHLRPACDIVETY